MSSTRLRLLHKQLLSSPPRPSTEQSPDRRDRELLADLAGQAVVDLAVARDRGFRAVGRIGIDRVTAAFSINRHPCCCRWPISSCLFKLGASRRAGNLSIFGSPARLL